MPTSKGIDQDGDAWDPEIRPHRLLEIAFDIKSEDRNETEILLRRDDYGDFIRRARDVGSTVRGSHSRGWLAVAAALLLSVTFSSVIYVTHPRVGVLTVIVEPLKPLGGSASPQPTMASEFNLIIRSPEQGYATVVVLGDGVSKTYPEVGDYPLHLEPDLNVREANEFEVKEFIGQLTADALVFIVEKDATDQIRSIVESLPPDLAPDRAATRLRESVIEALRRAGYRSISFKRWRGIPGEVPTSFGASPDEAKSR